MAPRVGVVMGSKSDAPTMQLTLDVLAEMGIEAEQVVVSAHRTPEKAREYGTTARARGLQVLIAGAGMAAALPGALASWTTLPVIGVPLPGSALNGVDALYAIVQMPAGVPVATVAIGNAGARNAAYLAAQIIGLHDERVRAAYDAYREKQAGG
jgi:5-(carboxyamino)imidazole ribonucleotide mutase